MGRIWHVLGVQKMHLSGSYLQGLPRPGSSGSGGDQEGRQETKDCSRKRCTSAGL